MLRRFSVTRAPSPRARASRDSAVATASPSESAGRSGQCRLRFRHLGFQPPGLLPGDGLLGPEPLPLLPQGAEPFGQSGDLTAGQVQADG